jgi:Tol biopolymer transport system component
VTFLSRATNLATNQPADGSIGVFVWDRLAGEATWLAPSVPVPTSSSTWGRARLSGDGGVVALDSLASDLVELDVNEARDVFWMPRVGGDASIVSRAFSGAPANLRVDASSVSETGRFIVFTTRANNLVPGDANGARDVFLHDTSSATTELISVGLGGGPASDASSFPSVSADGRYVVFESEADDLVDGDTNGVLDVFMRDTLQGVTIRVSVTASGSQLQAPSRVSAISADGRFVTFTSSAEDLVPGDTNGEADLFLYDVAARTQRLVPVDTRFGASMSRDGTRLAVSTEAGLVPEDTNGVRDVYVWDQGTGEVILASVSSAGELGTHASSAPSLSADGRVVAFASLADNLDPGDPLGVQDVFVRDLVQGTTRRVARPLTESILLEEVFDQYASTSPRVSADGRLVLFRSSEQLWVHDRGVDQTRPLQGTLPADPLVPRFIQGSGSLSSDGRFVVFASLLTLVTGATVGKDNLYVLPMSTQP